MITSKERANSYEEAIRAAIGGNRASLWTALPGYIVLFNAAKQTASVQPTLTTTVTAKDGSKSQLQMPVLLDCPVQFPRGGQCVITFPVAPGDECLIVFASRCIDAWWQGGGIQPQSEVRMHDLSDGFAIMGVSSVPHAVSALSTSAVEVRSLDNTTKLSLNAATQTVTIQATTATKAIFSPSGIALTSTALTHNGKNIGATHTHNGVTTGSGVSGVPT